MFTGHRVFFMHQTHMKVQVSLIMHLVLHKLVQTLQVKGVDECAQEE